MSKQAQALKELAAERDIIYSSLTRFKTFYDRFDKTLSNVVPLQIRLEKLEPMFEKFEEIQTQIELNPQLATLGQNQSSIREHFENEYVLLVSLARDHISSKTRSVQIASTGQASNSSSPFTINGDSGYKLPKLPLPTFDGSVENWVQYRDTFKAAVHDKDISNIDKFHYLNQTLTGPATKIIRSLGISEANYEIAWKSLTDRYEDSNALVHHHIRALCEHESVIKESFMELRQLIDDTNSNLRALNSLGESTDTWDTLVIYLICKKLDAVTRREWERKQVTLAAKPTLKDFLNFLENQCKYLQRSYTEKQIITSHSKSGTGNNQKRQNSHVTTEKPSCVACKGSHALYECSDFKTLPVIQRLKLVRENHLCYNCLSNGHGNKTCKLRPCKKCPRKHNTLLHLESNNQALENKDTSSETPCKIPDQANHIVRISSHSCNQVEPHVVLSTAIICIQDNHGKWHECRAFLDNGSQPHLITQDLCNKLQLPLNPFNVMVTGVSPAGLSLNKRANISIKSKVGGYESNLRCLVTSRITNFVPISARDLINVTIPSHIQLADPIIENPQIDLLIGGGLFWDLLCVGRIKLSSSGPLLQKTVFGWILAGEVMPHQQRRTSELSCGLITNQQLHDQVEQLWKIEDVGKDKGMADLDPRNACEQHFTKTIQRNVDGRFIVDVLYDEKVNELGDSFQMAKKRLCAIERKLDRDPELKGEYHKFINEYIESADMSEVPSERINSESPVYYLPHHAVSKPDSTTTKIRVVFDGSAKTTSGTSLNEVQRIGPIVQDDLLSIVLRFRKHRYVLSADVAKMYRRVLVSQNQRKLQRILWRTSPCEPIKVFELNTVTYGTAAVPYLATRCLRQLGEENKEKYPTASKVIINDFYVDDLLTGTNNLNEAKQLKTQLTSILEPAGFSLRKWASNNHQVLLTDDASAKGLSIDGDKDPKTLGLLWNSSSDELGYSVKLPEQERVTKRTVLSLISRIFDPLGLVGPASIRGKILLQQLWTFELDWNESLPQTLHSEWINFRNQLSSLNEIKVPRWILCEEPVAVQLHGFCDASEKAYGAAIYIRSVNQDGDTSVNLLCAKSKVAPLKKTTLPRLELCGALLLAQLHQKALKSLDLEISKSYFWCDSTITLAWIKASSSKWKTYVANRVSEIQELTEKNGTWNHVSSQDNPADIISRGINPEELIALKLWWNGPAWLSQPSDYWPSTASLDVQHVPELRQVTDKCVSNQATMLEQDSSLFKRFSSFNKLIRIISYCFRFRNKLARPTTELNIGCLTPQEMNSTRCRLIKIVQGQVFATEIHSLKKTNEVLNSSKLKPLKPFVDDLGLIRVGGRLTNAPISYDQKHPLVLPSDHALTQLIIKDEHCRLMHAGRQSVVASLRTQYWPLLCKKAVKGVLRNCVRCFPVNPAGTDYVMGNLPSARVTPSRPFNTTGIDYAGPYLVKDRTRSKVATKSYLCIFVCFVSKAVHLELATDLTTDAFLSCLKRFIARRGLCQNIYSDNGTNFIGACNELKTLLRNQQHQESVTNFAANKGITWHFIPSHAPHFGGLWESAVKSAKYHLKRVIGETRLTFSDLYTIITQIEACLNSRPLSPLSDDPNDLEPLTPAHFLIGDSLLSIPEPNLRDIPISRLNRYQHLQQMVQHFWHRWQQEYLHQLQQRYKWSRSHSEPIIKGSLVLIKEDNQPPLRWRLGRVIELHPGKDEITRVVSVKVSGGLLKRPVTKLCVLPVDNSHNSVCA